MFKHYFERIHDVEVWPIISLCIFFFFFISLLIWVYQVDKKYIHEMKMLPFGKGEGSSKPVKSKSKKDEAC